MADFGDTVDGLIETRPVPPKRSSSHKGLNATLVHIYPPTQAMGSRYPLEKKDLVLGRAPDCHICIEDGSVSRQHVRIEYSPTGYYAVDLGSTNGTFVNDTRIETARLRDGDSIRFGDCIFRFLSGDNVEVRYHEELHRLTIVDALTGVNNKRYFLEFLDRELKRANEQARPLSLILFDIDRFKAINDGLGHLGGDAILRELTARLKDHISPKNCLARYGGEEFALVLVDTPHIDAQTAAEQVRRRVEERPFSYLDGQYRVTISLGLASTSGRERWNPTDLIRQADDKLYQAKRAGRNRVMA
jgi:diguanylate cyclase (GGDEF)-like protein